MLMNIGSQFHKDSSLISEDQQQLLYLLECELPSYARAQVLNRYVQLTITLEHEFAAQAA
jgi:hypothetical protein